MLSAFTLLLRGGVRGTVRSKSRALPRTRAPAPAKAAAAPPPKTHDYKYMRTSDMSLEMLCAKGVEFELAAEATLQYLRREGDHLVAEYYQPVKLSGRKRTHRYSVRRAEGWGKLHPNQGYTVKLKTLDGTVKVHLLNEDQGYARAREMDEILEAAAA